MTRLAFDNHTLELDGRRLRGIGLTLLARLRLTITALLKYVYVQPLFLDARQFLLQNTNTCALAGWIHKAASRHV